MLLLLINRIISLTARNLETRDLQLEVAVAARQRILAQSGTALISDAWRLPNPAMRVRSLVSSLLGQQS